MNDKDTLLELEALRAELKQLRAEKQEREERNVQESVSSGPQREQDVQRAAGGQGAKTLPADLADWIDANCTFPNAMVDCIVPATGPKELALVAEFGIDDAVPVTHENFRQWVIEDDFCAGRPDLDKAGATFTDDVHDYEAMKIRILNGGHQVIANPGEVLSVETISDCMAHPLIAALFSMLGVYGGWFVGVGLLGGIGFTMSIFIAELGFKGQPEALVLAKTGVLFASVIAGIAGFLWLRSVSVPTAPVTRAKKST